MSCNHSGSSAGPDDENDFFLKPVFVSVSASGDSVTLGTDLESAKASERPRMTVVFDYDFLIQKNEVTCGQYAKLMASADCQGDSLPVAEVSYYDAVLFANALSKSENLDTSYIYESASFDGNGRCIGLEGLAFLPDVEGFRLPTEAEWVYAAQLDWDPESSWTAEDSVNSPSPVCSKSSSGICDMEGNVSEWVNDWMCAFKDTSITDYVGASGGNPSGERIIKGGNFRKETNFIKPYSRGDVYLVTSATRAPYVGFRLARGKIPSPTKLFYDGSFQESGVDVPASSWTLLSMTGSYSTKLAFRNDVTGNISYVDFSSMVPSAVEIQDTISSYHPEISPDGIWVAFCTGQEGVPGKSSLYVRRLDETGSGLVKLDVESAAIPRWKVLESGDTAIVYVTDAGNNKDGVAFLQKSTWQVPFSEGKFGSPKKLFNGAYHDGVEGNLAVTGARLLRARVGNRDTVWYNEEQACNVSLSKDGSRRTLFLDFGGKTGRDFVGESYGVHQRILIADSTGKLVKSIKAPEGFTFDHSEWASENMIVATLTNLEGAHRKVVLVNLKDSSVTDLVEGEEVWHPSLLLHEDQYGSQESVDLDSAAMYFSEDQGTPYIGHKMPVFWHLKDSLKVVAFGSSRTNAAFDATIIDSAMNMGTVPCDVHCAQFLIEKYVLNHCPRLKILVVEISFDLWMHEDDFDVACNLASAKGFAYDANHDYWKNGVPETLIAVSQHVFGGNPVLKERFYTHRGQNYYTEALGWVDDFDKAEVLDGAWDEDSDGPESNYGALEDIIAIAKEKDIYVVGTILPISPYYKETDMYGRHGMRRATAEKFLERLQELDKSEKNFVLVDENKMGEHEYHGSLAQDFDHLNARGAIRYTRALKEVLDTLKLP